MAEQDICPKCGIDRANVFGNCWQCAPEHHPHSKGPDRGKMIGLRPLGGNRFAVIRENDATDTDELLPIDDND